MKGLLVKDVYLIGKLCRAILIMDIFFLGVSVYKDSNLFFLIYPCMISGVLPMSLISYDEREKWDQYAGTLPYARAQMVSAKYIIGVCGIAIVLVLGSAAQAIRLLTAQNFAFGEYVSFIGIMLSISLIAPAVLFPLVFKFGAEKGRIFYYVIIVAGCIFSGILEGSGPRAFSGAFGRIPMVMLCSGSILLYALSWILSICFYQKREL